MAATSSPDAVLLEREAEVAALHALIDTAREGDGRLAILEGSPGIGKTRLLSEARSVASSAGLCVLHARAGELEGAFPFGIVRQLFESPLAAADEQARAELTSGAAELTVSLFASGQHAAVVAGAEASFAKLHGLYWLTANFGLRQPTMLAVDDLQWADEASLRWLAYLCRRLEGLPVIVVAATRPPDIGSTAEPLLTELLEDPLATVIRLGALDAPSAAALARARLLTEPEQLFVEALQRASGGNPLYLRALLDAAVDEGLTPVAANANRVLELGPQAVVRNVARRLALLPPEAAVLASGAAVVGDGATLSQAAAISGLGATVAGDAASTLVAHDLLRRGNPIEFFHPIVRTAVYEGITLGDRSLLHRRAAESLLAGNTAPDRVAPHLLQTLPAADPFVPRTLRSAAGRAMADGAPSAAVEFLRRALEEPPEDQLVDVLTELGDAERLVAPADALAHFAEAFALAREPDTCVPLAIRYSRALWVSGQFEEAIRVIQETIDEMPEAHAHLREELQAELIGAGWSHEGFATTSAAHITRIDDSALVGGIGSDRLLILLGDFEMRRVRNREWSVSLVERGLASGRLVDTLDFGLYSAVAVLIYAGELDRGAVVLEASIRQATRRGDVVATGKLRTLTSRLELERGRLRAAERDVVEAIELSALPTAESTAFVGHARAARIALDLGDLERARSHVAVIEPALPHLTAPLIIPLLDVRGRLRLAEGQAVAALDDHLACGETAELLQISNPASIAWRSCAAQALYALGRGDEAQALAREETAFARTWGEPGALGRALRVMGLVTGDLETLREASQTTASSPARLEHARSLVELGAALRRANQRSDARRLLREGVELAHRCGASAVAERANDELAATGAHRRTIVYSGVDALTASERRVAELAAGGAANKDIAQALFVTVKTVEMHLSRVYRKLQVESRGQLSAAFGDTAQSSRNTS